MARLLTAGAEWNDLTAESVTGGTGLSLSSANPRSGTFHFRAAGGNSQNLFVGPTFAGALGTTYYLRGAFYVASLGTNVFLLGFHDTLNRLSCQLQADGTLTLADVSGVPFGVASAPVSAGTYFVAELALNIGVGATDYVEGRLNGVSFYASSTQNLTDTAPSSARFCSDQTVQLDCDDVALNDSTGAAQNSWPGLGKIVLLKPSSLNANGGSWTDDAAASTSAALTSASDNSPPQGIADTTAGGGNHQDRNAGANTSLDMNLSTYAMAGIAGGDTINVVQLMCNTAAPVVTSAKTGSLGVTTNPTIANIAFVNGASAAANFWSGVAAGTYPTGWKWEKGTITYAPVVTVSSSPVARITITGGTTTRVAMVDAIGLYVDYTPAPADLLDLFNPIPFLK